MRWRQFFTPAKSVDVIAGKQMIDQAASGELTILDVRQPSEYEAGHLPGARLIPLPELGDRLGELDKEKPTLVY
jgi:sulfur-carrier protein adenylyltransferase/sulfurtransferase